MFVKFAYKEDFHTLISSYSGQFYNFWLPKDIKEGDIGYIELDEDALEEFVITFNAEEASIISDDSDEAPDSIYRRSINGQNLPRLTRFERQH